MLVRPGMPVVLYVNRDAGGSTSCQVLGDRDDIDLHNGVYLDNRLPLVVEVAMSTMGVRKRSSREEESVLHFDGSFGNERG